MSGYKKLNKQDSFITSYTAHKLFLASGSQHDELGVETYVGISGSTAFNITGSNKRLVGTDYEHYEDLVYRSIKHLYYSGFENAEPSTSSYDISGSSVENYLQSSYTSQQRRDEGQFTVISIPRNLIGTNIQPSSILLQPGNIPDYATDNYATGSTQSSDAQGYFEDNDETYQGGDSSNAALDPTKYKGTYLNSTDTDLTSSGSTYNIPWGVELIDDGNGNILLSGSAGDYRRVVGNVIYSHGLIILTNPTIADYYSTYFSGSITWRASHPIYTHNYHCNIKENEFNFSQHPSAKKDTSGSIADNVSGSEFQPYFTSVGLYNETNELIAIAKMAKPVLVSENTEMTVVVKLDI